MICSGWILQLSLFGFESARPWPGLFAARVGVLREKANADREMQAMNAYGDAVCVMPRGNLPVWRVLAGRENSQEAAESLTARIRSERNVPKAFGGETGSAGCGEVIGEAGFSFQRLKYKRLNLA